MSLLGTEREGAPPDGLAPATQVSSGRRQQTTISGRVPAPRWASPWWLLFAGLAIAEVVALGVRKQRVPTESDWSNAAAYVRSELTAKDAIAVAPAWADPLLRLYLGDRITLKMEGRPELAPYERLWVLTIRGQRAREAPLRAPDFETQFGRVRVERYDLGPSTVVFDLADALASAHVSRQIEGVEENCVLRTFPPAVVAGGLGGGVVPPRQRFQCDFERPWLWVGLTMIETLDLSPLRCIWTHPQGRDPIIVSYQDVPLAPRLVLYAGLDYHDERDQNKAPVTLRVRVNGREVATLVHRDGDGKARYVIDLREDMGGNLPERGELRFEVTTPEPFRRSFCWTGTLQSRAREPVKEAP